MVPPGVPMPRAPSHGTAVGFLCLLAHETKEVCASVCVYRPAYLLVYVCICACVCISVVMLQPGLQKRLSNKESSDRFAGNVDQSSRALVPMLISAAGGGAGEAETRGGGRFHYARVACRPPFSPSPPSPLLLTPAPLQPSAYL